MAEQAVAICNKLGLHARASAKLAVTAAAYPCEVFISQGSVEVNGKSIMGIMMLAAGKGSIITIRTEGKGDKAALNAIVQLIEERFGEAE
ncbi:MAG: HPr family phosphocarrier protein [Zetaproteobacteria bacterium CG12_big_fil_rev_8_21_14_0_65_55_1124]|nr:MAG: phosphocarrier protein HPr [Zetaproteobacteria bacterium CG1_02_55_237]PIS19550.1 MAG: HPr family phosphocarrier protein [Zetaproteobacteria bacterium CG08_land_8_20_14_0_20_55_17]PIW42349.1 MAG: HPr family phosphocarrier protein [Zetaproteobacteria bacterium CG12_big_fil_rev_8_21_14_0_65_55_1124]PIY52850.1 MAG: HPr family phosphocarrier protein [Zetaproteobacteria bacterium CG_4_10_14_0_8_um_filter_55_43]PIZ38056.1 MAG: HPr family phosphocarrier protein [Zetaproteobacteria bacterium CG